VERSQYAETVEAKLGPLLGDLGFRILTLKDCMRPEVLYRRQDLWFGTTRWTPREPYLDVRLGTLVWIKDVMPRVAVVGRFEKYCPALIPLTTSTRDPSADALDLISETFRAAISARDAQPETEVSETNRLRHLILGRVTDAELARFEA